LQREYALNYEEQKGAKAFYSLKSLGTWAWLTLAINVLVILSGAYVRVTKSGNGCGNHWPLCNGEVIPPSPEVKTLIEFSHRLLTGLALIFVLNLVIQAYRSYPKKHLVRLGATLSIILIIIEALIGAGLVKFELVADNASMTRAVYMAIHLVNTFLLIGCIALTAWWTYDNRPINLRGQGSIAVLLVVGLIGTLLIGMSGAIAALGDTLFPSTSLADGIKQDFSPTAHFLIRLRFLHPTIALIVGIYAVAGAMFISYIRPSLWIKRFAILASSLVILQLGAGVLNLILLAPLWMQILHLLLADLLWLSLVLLSATALAERPYMDGVRA
jgi:heme A synthase